MASLTLPKPDIGLWADFEATRIQFTTLKVATPSEAHDSAMVQFDGDDLPTEFAGEHRTGTVECTARFIGTNAEHAACVAFVGLLRTARAAADRRLQLRTNHGLSAGFDEVHVGTVPSWQRPHLMGQAWDVIFTFNQTVATVEAD